jgi:purine-cytosine permease-like protein
MQTTFEIPAGQYAQSPPGSQPRRKQKNGTLTAGVAILILGLVILLSSSYGGRVFGLYQLVVSMPAVLVGLVLIAVGAVKRKRG